MATLGGKVALVTGAARGIGAAIAKRLAQEGAAVAITYSSSAGQADELVKVIESGGGRAIALKADSADSKAVRSAVKDTVERLGRLDILVNNAGVLHIAPITEFPEDQFEKAVAVNIGGVFAATQEAARHMGEGGRIIMLGSINSDFMPFPGGSVYSLTKAAVAGFTHGLARDLGPRGITVNNLQPGPINTDMNPSHGPFAETMKTMIAVGRYGTTEEIAGLVAFLAGPEAGYINGASIRIDGGFGA